MSDDGQPGEPPGPKPPADTSWVQMSDLGGGAKREGGQWLVDAVIGFFRDLFNPADPEELLRRNMLAALRYPHAGSLTSLPLLPPGGQVLPPAAEVQPRGTWVRWSEFNAWTPWRLAGSVETDGHWLLITWPGVEGMTMVPDHIVRGQVQVRYGDQPDKS